MSLPMQSAGPPQNPLTGDAGAHHRMDVNLGGKAPQPDAHYTPQTMDPATACQNCMAFQAPNKCAVVAGQISPAGTCDLFEGQDQMQSGQAAPAGPPPSAPGPMPGGMLG